MNQMLNRAKGLYIDRQRIALASMIIIFSISLYLFYGLEILCSIILPPERFPNGIVLGVEVVFALNTIALAIVCCLLVIGYYNIIKINIQRLIMFMKNYIMLPFHKLKDILQ